MSETSWISETPWTNETSPMRTSPSLWWRNAFFTVLQPGMVAVVIPLWIAGGVPALSTWSVGPWLGVIVLGAGVLITLICIYGFITKGNGTLSPADPTKRLLVSGLYRYSRNPMYVGVTLMLLGDCLILQKQALWIYAGIVLVAFVVFVVTFEEPRLRKDFGDEYDDYCKRA